jgi:hypothetical protein
MKKAVLMLMLLLSLVGALEFLSEGKADSAAKKSMPAERRPASDDIPFVVVDAGTSSGITTREHYVIKDEGQWLALWQKHTSTEYPAPAAPHVDFDNEMVVAVFAGEHHKPGCSIQIDTIKKTDNKIIILVSESGPGAGRVRELNPLGDTEPYFIARAAQNSLPISFQGM